MINRFFYWVSALFKILRHILVVPHKTILGTFSDSVYFLFFLWTVEGSASWRIPLGVQLIPGITLAIGCVFLPPSPRLLVAQGRNDEALQTLAKLRLRSENEVQDDPLLQVRFLAFCLIHLCTLFLVSTFSRLCFPVIPRVRSRHCLHSVACIFQED